MSYDESGDLTHNPFAEDNDYLSESILDQENSSSLFTKLSNPLSLSAQNSGSVKGTTGEGGKRLRSVPEISIVESAVGLHPLKSVLARQNDNVLYDLGITRPHLSRIISERTLIKDNLSEQDDTSTVTTPPASKEEIEVIVHQVRSVKPSLFSYLFSLMSQVTSKDSLAGVSLKYGISLPNLRKANQLWATDSIHLRDVLYIPIEQAFRAREFMPEPQFKSLTPESQEPETSIHAPPIRPSTFTKGTAELTSASPMIPIRKIPSSQLTFFPRSSNKNLESSLNGSFEDIVISLHPSQSHSSPAGFHNRHISSPASYSLSSILTALPIAASTRDEIITRLSFDSVSSNFSDKSRTNSDEETGHELDDVAKHKNSRIRKTLCEDVDEMSMPTPKALQNPEILPSQQGSRNTSSSSLPKDPNIRSLSSTTPPRFYVSHAYETSVRTYQMEPSPSMQLPDTFRNHTVVHRSGRRAQEKATADSSASSAVLQRKPRS